MSAEILRRAASLMRERAYVATPSKWLTDDNEVWTTPDAHHIITIAQPAKIDDAEHIASWHPAVALAVADWLDADATVIERHDLDVTVSKAYDVARAYLGEPA